MKSIPRSSISAALALASVLFCLALSEGCTLKRAVNIRYTPLAQTQRLADRTSPQTVVVGQFGDARTQRNLSGGSRRGFTSFQYNAIGDVPTVVRSAFVDGFLKAGFEVPMPDESASSPIFQLTGKVLTYEARTKVGLTKVIFRSNVGVEVTIARRTGAAVSFPIHGQATTEIRTTVDDSAIADSLDRALQDCVKRFLEDGRFLELLKK